MNRFLLIIFSIISVLGFAQVSPQTFSVAGTGAFTVPCGITSLTVECWGGGGGGGCAAGNPSGGGGGGGGAYAYRVLTVTPGQSISYTVGAGGAGATVGTSNGVSGTASTFSTNVSAAGGTGGNSSNSNNNSAAGGARRGCRFKFR